MSTAKSTKINRLVKHWPRGTVGTAVHLKSWGYSYDLLKKYKESGWINSFGRGAYILSGDKVEWPGALFALQSQLGLNIYAGGKTALELKGYAHYLSEQKNRLYLYGDRAQRLPAWFNDKSLELEVVMIRTNLFPAGSEEGYTEIKEREFSVKISAPERAILELLYLVPNKAGFSEVQLIMENLVSLRPTVVQALLQNCRSIKVKRLFMYLADKHSHQWVSEIDTSKVNLGKGKRLIVPNGKLDHKYQITVPVDRFESQI